MKENYLLPSKVCFFQEHLSEHLKVDIESIVLQGQEALQKTQERQQRYFNQTRLYVGIQVGQEVLVQIHDLNSAPKEVVVKFAPKFEGSLPRR